MPWWLHQLHTKEGRKKKAKRKTLGNQDTKNSRDRRWRRGIEWKRQQQQWGRRRHQPRWWMKKSNNPEFQIEGKPQRSFCRRRERTKGKSTGFLHILTHISFQIHSHTHTRFEIEFPETFYIWQRTINQLQKKSIRKKGPFYSIINLEEKAFGIHNNKCTAAVTVSLVSSKFLLFG